jgi:hypothetical protein
MANSREYIDALNDFTQSLEAVVEALKNQAKKDDDADGGKTMEDFFGENSQWFKFTESIVDSIKDQKKYNKKNAKKQDEILQHVKDLRASKETGIFDKISGADNKKGMIDGIKSVVLIAGAVMAVGLAFKIIGDVDFASVVALSIALPMIALAFAQMKEAGQVSLKDIMGLGLALVSGSIAMVLASYILKNIQPIGFNEFISAVQISAIFVVLSFGMEMMLDSLKGVKDKSILMLPITLVAMATAVMLSSYILQETQDIPFMTNLIAAVTVAAVTIVMGIALWVLNKLDSGNILKGAFSVVIIAGTVAAASQLLAMGDYSNFPTIDWGLGVGMAMIAFVPAMLITGNFLPMIAMGAIGALLVAGTILASSYILGTGDYSGGPTTEWATGVGLAFLAFAPAMLIMGNPLFLIMAGIGALSLLIVANTIVEVADILGSTDFSGGPSAEWAEGVGLSLVMFTAALNSVSPGVLDFLLNTSLEDKIQNLKGAVKAMVEIAGELNDNSAVFDESKAPSKGWAEGVGTSLVMFTQALSMVEDGMFDKVFGGGIEDKIQNLKAAVSAMVAIAGFLGQNSASFDESKAPSKAWAEGAGGSIVAFTQAMATLEDVDIEDGIDGIMMVARNIPIVAALLSVGNYSNPIDSKYLSSLDKLVKIVIEAGDNDGEIEDGIEQLQNMAVGLIDFSKKMMSVSALTGGKMGFIDSAASGIERMADAYKLLADSLKGLTETLSTMEEQAMNTLGMVSGSILAMSLADSDNLNKVISDNTEALAEMFKVIMEQSSKTDIMKNPVANKAPVIQKKSGSTTQVDKQTVILENMLKELQQMKSTMGQVAANTGEMVELMSTSGKKKEKGISH